MKDGKVIAHNAEVVIKENLIRFVWNNGRNYFEKARYWLYCVDEPIQTNRVELANQTFAQFHETAQAVADEVENWTTPDNGEITKSLLAEEIRNAKEREEEMRQKQSHITTISAINQVEKQTSPTVLTPITPLNQQSNRNTNQNVPEVCISGKEYPFFLTSIDR